MTRREPILARVDEMFTALKGNDEPVFNFIDVGKISTADLETAATPALWVFQGPESRQPEVTGFEVWDWTLILEVWARDADMEHLLGLIHTTMAKNNADGGLICSSTMGVIDVKRQSCEMTLVDPTKSLEMMSITYSVWYRHPYGTP